MSNLNSDILIQNINDLMTNNSITQKKLGEILGMSQPNINHALNPNNKKCFTLDQVIGIANHFNVSIDFLVGNTPKKSPNESISNKDICSFLMSLIEHDIVSCLDISPTEIHFEKEPCEHTYDSQFAKRKGPITYKAFYFSKFYQFEDWSADNFADFEEEYFHTGNLLDKNDEINDFLSYFFKLYDLLKNNKLERKIFDQANSAKLETLKY